MERRYQICTFCIMDTSDRDIQFDKDGVCNHCKEFVALSKAIELDVIDYEGLNHIIDRIKREGRNKQYDCIIGVSGGVDSTYAAYKARELGLRPLAVHFDNGWNSELAVKNIENVLKRLEIDLYTYVVDWEEYRDLQLSFLKASVPDGEIPTDHGIGATLLKVASQQTVRNIITGGNFNTEAILPMSYGYDVRDWRYIKNIHRLFGKHELKTFPRYGILRRLYYIFVKRFQVIPILDYVAYNKGEAMKIIESELGWKYYGGKHYESIYTRFYQAYILPRKFNIDKRRAHLSTLILSGQMSREEALQEMEKDPYPEDKLKEDKEYVIKKLGLTEKEFEEIMNLPLRTFADYPSYYPFLSRISKIKNKAKKWGLIPRRVGI